MSLKRLWFEEWFDSPFYHILYGHRDEVEANRFMHKLIAHLSPNKDCFFLDLACGKGRHAVAIHDMGYVVHGMDLSQNSIEYAKDFEKKNLTFSVGDMQKVYFPNTFDCVLNLFTSFGYFNKLEDHAIAIKAICDQLKPGGRLVIDYVNVLQVEKELSQPQQSKLLRSGITFKIKKYLSENQINKSIEFKVNNDTFHFKEHIWRLKLDDFKSLLEENGFSIQTIFGDYELEEFNPLKSNRLILIAHKI